MKLVAWLPDCLSLVFFASLSGKPDLVACINATRITSDARELFNERANNNISSTLNFFHETSHVTKTGKMPSYFIWACLPLK